MKNLLQTVCEQSIKVSSIKRSKIQKKTQKNVHKRHQILMIRKTVTTPQEMFSPQTSLPSYYSVCSELNSSDYLSEDDIDFTSDDSKQSSLLVRIPPQSDSLSVFFIPSSSWDHWIQSKSQPIVEPTL